MGIYAMCFLFFGFFFPNHARIQHVNMSLVIDAYAVLLNAEQERMNEGIDAADKSYFFSSICLVSLWL